MSTRESPNDVDVVELATRLQATAAADPRLDTLAEAIKLADQLGVLSHSLLSDSVVRARAHALSWQAIGDTLGISRQAAFKKFSGAEQHPPRDTAAAEAVLSARTEAVFASLDADDFAAVRAMMTFTCSRELTKRKVMHVWAEMRDSTGRFTRCSGTHPEPPAGRDAVERFLNRHAGAITVIQTRLHHESGEWIARVAYTSAGKIAGILITAPGSSDLAF